MNVINELHDLCEVVSRKIAEANEKIRKAGGELAGGDVEYIDKLTHTLKSLKTTIAMMEASDGYSNRGGNSGFYPMYGGSYRGGSNAGGSYAGGGSYAEGGNRSNNDGSYARGRDPMGRFTGYSGHPDPRETREYLRMAMESAPDENMRREIERIMGSVNG